MADDKKISDLDDGGLIQTTDAIPAQRGPGNVRVVFGSAAAKAASDPALDSVASVSGEATVGHLAIFADPEGTIQDGGPVPDGIAAILGADVLDSVSTSDFVPVIHDGVLYLALVSSVLAAVSPPGSGSQLNFSIAGNSGLAAGVM